MVHVEAQSQRMLTSDESALFHDIGVHLSQEVEGHSPTEAIAANLALAAELTICLIDWAIQPQSAE
ncbi:MAG TPA: hypothetical protein V6C84_16130 [Coleofasciculaceae cyanobacterium]